METRKRNYYPASQEAVRQRIMLGLHTIEKETNLFEAKFLDDTEDSKNLIDIANFVCETFGTKLKKIEDCKEFRSLLKAAGSNEEVKFGC